MKEPIYLVMSAYDMYSGYNVHQSAGYFLSEQKALDYCEEQVAQDYEDWKNDEWRDYHYEMENYLYPELILQSDESRLLADLFAQWHALEPQKPEEPDTSMKSYREQNYPTEYRIQKFYPHETLVKEHNDNG